VGPGSPYVMALFADILGGMPRLQQIFSTLFATTSSDAASGYQYCSNLFMEVTSYQK